MNTPDNYGRHCRIQYDGNGLKSSGEYVRGGYHGQLFGEAAARPGGFRSKPGMTDCILRKTLGGGHSLFCMRRIIGCYNDRMKRVQGRIRQHLPSENDVPKVVRSGGWVICCLLAIAVGVVCLSGTKSVSGHIANRIAIAADLIDTKTTPNIVPVMPGALAVDKLPTLVFGTSPESLWVGGIIWLLALSSLIMLVTRRLLASSLAGLFAGWLLIPIAFALGRDSVAWSGWAGWTAVMAASMLALGRRPSSWWKEATEGAFIGFACAVSPGFLLVSAFWWTIVARRQDNNRYSHWIRLAGAIVCIGSLSLWLKDYRLGWSVLTKEQHISFSVIIISLFALLTTLSVIGIWSCWRGRYGQAGRVCITLLAGSLAFALSALLTGDNFVLPQIIALLALAGAGFETMLRRSRLLVWRTLARGFAAAIAGLAFLLIHQSWSPTPPDTHVLQDTQVAATRVRKLASAADRVMCWDDTAQLHLLVRRLSPQPLSLFEWHQLINTRRADNVLRDISTSPPDFVIVRAFSLGSSAPPPPLVPQVITQLINSKYMLVESLRGYDIYALSESVEP